MAHIFRPCFVMPVIIVRPALIMKLFVFPELIALPAPRRVRLVQPVIAMGPLLRRPVQPVLVLALIIRNAVMAFVILVKMPLIVRKIVRK